MNLKRHHVLYIFLAVSLMLGLLLLLTPHTPEVSYIAPSASSSTQNLMLGQASTSPAQAHLTFEVVTTQAEQERGLGGRAAIPEKYAMLFVFPTDQKVGFWMKDMLTSIDMIWLSDTGTIIHIDENVPADSYHSDTDAKVYYPPQPVKYVLETRASEARRLGWSIGTKVALPLPYGS